MTNLITPFRKKIIFYFYPIFCTNFIVPILLTSPIVPIFGLRLFLTNLSTPFRKKRTMTNLITPFRKKIIFYFYPIFCTNFIVPILLTSPIVPIFGPRLFLMNLSTPFRKKRPMTNLITPFRENVLMTDLSTPFRKKYPMTNLITPFRKIFLFFFWFLLTKENNRSRNLFKKVDFKLMSIEIRNLNSFYC